MSINIYIYTYMYMRIYICICIWIYIYMYVCIVIALAQTYREDRSRPEILREERDPCFICSNLKPVSTPLNNV